MKVHIRIDSNPVQLALEKVLEVLGHQLGDSEEADAVVTNNPAFALKAIKDTEAKVVVTYLPAYEEDKSVAAMSLAEEYPERVVVAPYVAPEGEQDLVLRLLTLLGGKE